MKVELKNKQIGNGIIMRNNSKAKEENKWNCEKISFIS